MLKICALNLGHDSVDVVANTEEIAMGLSGILYPLSFIFVKLNAAVIYSGRQGALSI